MPTTSLLPTSLIASSGFASISLANIDEDPDTPDTAWAVASANNTATSARVGFDTPPGPPSGVQTFKIRVKKFNTNSGTPTCRIDLYENGVQVAQGATQNVTSTTGQTLSQTFDLASLSLSDPSGAGVEAFFTSSPAGGSPSVRNSVDLGAINWDIVNYIVLTPALHQKAFRFRADDSQALNALFGTLIHSDDFESTTIWTGGGEVGDTHERSSTWAADGTFSQRHAGTRAGTHYQVYRPNTITGIVAGRQYVVRASFKNVAGNGSKLGVNWRDSTFAWMSVFDGSVVPVGSEGVSEAVGTAPSGAIGIGVEMNGNGVMTGAFDHYMDKLEVYEGSASLDPAVGADVSRTIGDVIRCRFEVQEAGGAAIATGFKLQFSKNSGAWTDVGAATDCQYAAASGFADGAATTNIMSVGTGTFVAGEGSEDGVVASVSLPASGHTEHEFAVKLGGATVAGDLFDLRLVRSDGTVLETYTDTPRITAIGADVTAPTTDLGNQTRTVISRVPGFDAFDVTVSTNEPFVEYEIRRVPSSTSTRTEGSQIETGVVSARTSLTVTITDDELVAASGAEGDNIVKGFTKDASGNWSG